LPEILEDNNIFTQYDIHSLNLDATRVRNAKKFLIIADRAIYIHVV